MTVRCELSTSRTRIIREKESRNATHTNIYTATRTTNSIAWFGDWWTTDESKLCSYTCHGAINYHTIITGRWTIYLKQLVWSTYQEQRAICHKIFLKIAYSVEKNVWIKRSRFTFGTYRCISAENGACFAVASTGDTGAAVKCVSGGAFNACSWLIVLGAVWNLCQYSQSAPCHGNISLIQNPYFFVLALFKDWRTFNPENQAEKSY